MNNNDVIVKPNTLLVFLGDVWGNDKYYFLNWFFYLEMY